MIKKIIDNNVLLAKIIKADYNPTTTEFFTDENDELQFGVMFYEKNHKTGAHYHNHLKTKTNQTDEILIVQNGALRIDFYNDKGEYIKSIQAKSGDTVILYKGGHNFVFEENTKLLSIKKGAYDKETSKTRIVGANNMELVIDNS